MVLWTGIVEKTEIVDGTIRSMKKLRVRSSLTPTFTSVKSNREMNLYLSVS